MKNKLLTGGTLVVSAVFFIVWWLLFAGNENSRMWYAFLVNFLFFTSVSGGLVVWPAIIVSTYGNWMGRRGKILLDRTCFFPCLQLLRL